MGSQLRPTSWEQGYLRPLLWSKDRNQLPQALQFPSNICWRFLCFSAACPTSGARAGCLHVLLCTRPCCKAGLWAGSGMSHTPSTTAKGTLGPGTTRAPGTHGGADNAVCASSGHLLHGDGRLWLPNHREETESFNPLILAPHCHTHLFPVSTKSSRDLGSLDGRSAEHLLPVTPAALKRSSILPSHPSP